MFKLVEAKRSVDMETFEPQIKASVIIDADAFDANISDDVLLESVKNLLNSVKESLK